MRYTLLPPSICKLGDVEDWKVELESLYQKHEFANRNKLHKVARVGCEVQALGRQEVVERVDGLDDRVQERLDGVARRARSLKREVWRYMHFDPDHEAYYFWE